MFLATCISASRTKVDRKGDRKAPSKDLHRQSIWTVQKVWFSLNSAQPEALLIEKVIDDVIQCSPNRLRGFLRDDFAKTAIVVVLELLLLHSRTE